MKTITLSKSNLKNKKFKVEIQDGEKTKTIHFGDPNYDDFTVHKDETRKLNYIKRHQSRELWTDPFTAGFWSKNLLWSLPDFNKSLNSIKLKLSNFKIINNV